MRRLTRQRGLTLIELMVGLTIAAFLAITAAPYFADYTANSRLRESGNVLYAETLAAQAEAIKRNGMVRLTVNGGTVQVLDRTQPAAMVVLRERLLAENVSASGVTVDFGSEGRPLPFPTTAAVNLAYAGVSCSDEFRCPGLRIEAGGAVRVCANHLASGC